MEVSSSSSSSSAQAAQSSNVSVELHKKSLEIQEQAAKEIIQSIPDPDSSLGQHVDEMV